MVNPLFIVTAYLLGSISFGIITCKLFGIVDPRTHGSGNLGATNVLRSGKKLAAILTLLGDAGKGWLITWLAQVYELPQIWIAGVAIAVFVGHIFPVYYSFRGGKGVATAAGILLAISPWLGISVLITWIFVFIIWRISSLSAIISAAFAPLYGLFLFGLDLYSMLILLLSVILLWRHKSNIQRLLAKEEQGFKKT